MWKNFVELGRPQMVIWRMRIACWVTNATNTHEITTHTKQLQYTRSTNNNYTQDNLKLATKHTRQIRMQHVRKVKTPK